MSKCIRWKISNNLIKPEIIIDYKHGNIESFIHNLDFVLAEIGLTAIRVRVSEMTTHVTEGGSENYLALVCLDCCIVVYRRTFWDKF
jgi:hypothetical protein